MAAVQGRFERGEQVAGGGAQQRADGARVDRRDGVHGQREPVAVVVGVDGERVVVAVLGVTQRDARHRVVRVTRRAAVVTVVEQGGEQRRVPGDAARLLRDGQRCVLVPDERGELAAHRADRFEHARPAGADAYREGVHVRAGHPVGAGARVHPAEQHRPEHHVVAT